MMYDESWIAKVTRATDAARTATEDSVRLLAEADRPKESVVKPGRFDYVPLTKLIGYLIDKHHVYARRQMESIGELIAALTAAHGGDHPTLARVRRIFKNLRQELLFHMEKEEVSLFPNIIRTEMAARGGEAQAAPYFGPMRDPVRMLTREHDELCAMLNEIRLETNDFTPHTDTCAIYRMLCQALKDLEFDLLQLIHLEENVLFPRALRLESSERR